MQKYASTLLLNGYQTVEDLKHLQEKDLIELNVTDPEHRCKLLAASEVIYDITSEYHSPPPQKLFSEIVLSDHGPVFEERPWRQLPLFII